MFLHLIPEAGYALYACISRRLTLIRPRCRRWRAIGSVELTLLRRRYLKVSCTFRVFRRRGVPFARVDPQFWWFGLLGNSSGSRLWDLWQVFETTEILVLHGGCLLAIVNTNYITYRWMRKAMLLYNLLVYTLDDCLSSTSLLTQLKSRRVERV